MTTLSSRRGFLRDSLAFAIAGAGLSRLPGARAVEPFTGRGAPRLQLSLAAYSFRDYFKHQDPNKRMTLFDFVDYCAEQGCAGTELTAYYFPTPVTNEFLLDVKRHAFLHGIDISGSAVGNNFALPPGKERDEQIKMVKIWIDHAAVLGAPHIRVFAGQKPKEVELDAAKKFCIEASEECAEYAGKKGIFLGLENHGGIVAEPSDLLEIVKAVKSCWYGINLDTGNFQTDDPYADLARCAPYAVNVQVKVEIKRRGQAKKEPSDLKRLVKILREVNYQGYVALEYEAAEDPLKAVPGWLDKLRSAIVG
jgi:sugar phosphate isomerase/epimerase